MMLTEEDKAAIRKALPALARLVETPAEPPPPPTVRLTAGQDLQRALNTLPADAVLELETGATWLGTFVTPPGTGRRTVRGGILKSGGAGPALSVPPGSHEWTFEDLRCIGDTRFRDVVRLGSGAADQNTLDAVPQRLVLRGVSIDGDPVTQHRALALNSGDTTIDRLTIRNIRSKTSGDAAGIAGWNGPGPYTITNVDMEVAGIGIFFGGADPFIPHLVPSDITIDGWRSVKPLAWRAEGWACKNHFELKNARRVSLRNATLVNQWAGAQAYAVNLKSVNQGGQEGGVGAPWCVTEDVNIENVRIENASGGITAHPNPDGKAIPMHDVRFKNVFVQCSREMGGRSPLLVQGVEGLLFEHVSFLTDTDAVLQCDVAANPRAIFRGCIFQDNLYGVKGTGIAEGRATFDHFFPGAVFEDNLVMTASPTLYQFGERTRVVLPPMTDHLDADFQDLRGLAGWRKT